MKQSDPDATAILPVVPEPVEPDESPGAGSIGRSSAGMALGSLVSRGTGFLRAVLITAALGSAVGDAYTNATYFPGMVYELLLGGVLASVLVPLLVRARETQEDRGEAYTHRLLSASVLFLGIATVLAVVCAPLLAQAVANSENLGLTTTWAYMILPTIFFYGLAALFAAVLNTRGHFAAPVWAPILNNLLLCATAGLVLLLPHPKNLTLDNIPGRTVLLIGLGTALGIVLQAVSLVPALRRVGFRWRWRFDLRALPLREIGRLGGWMICYVAVSQVAVIVMLYLANKAKAQDPGAAGSLTYNNVYLLMMMAHGIIAVSILTVLMPRLSTSAASGRLGDVAADLARGTRLVIVLLTPVSVVYLTLSYPIIISLFKGEQFTAADAAAASPVLAVSALALIPFSVSQLQTFAFYALPDTRTPALINMPVVGVRIGVGFLLYLVLPASGIVAGLLFGNAVSFIAAVVLSGWLLRRRLGPLGMRAVAVTGGKAAIAGLVALGAGYAVNLGLRDWVGSDKLGNLTVVVVGTAAIGFCYLGVAHLLKITEITETVGMVRRKLGR